MTETFGAEGTQTETRIDWLGVGIFLAIAAVVPSVLLMQMKEQGLAIGEAVGGLPFWMTATLILAGAIGALMARWLGKDGFADARPKWLTARVFWQIYFLTMGLTLLAYALSALFGWVAVDPEISAFKATMREVMESAIAASGQSLPASMLDKQVDFVIMGQYFVFVVGALFAMVVAFPTQWGWMGYLYPRLQGAWGAKSGAWAVSLAIGGTSWASLAMMGEVQLMGHSPDSALWGGMLGTILLSFIACFVFSKTRSVWATALLVGGAQVFLGVPAMYTTTPTSWLAAPYGLAYTLVLAVVVWRVSGMAWEPTPDRTQLLEVEAPYEIPDGPAIPEPVESAPPEETEEEPDYSPGGAG